MKIFIMEHCPGCVAVKELLKKYKVEDKFTLIDINNKYEGYVPESVPVLQDSDVGVIQGEQLINFLNKIYGNK